MKITSVRVTVPKGPTNEMLKGFATIEINNCFKIRDLKIIKGPGGFFIAMPAKKLKDGSFRDLCHPVNKGARQMIEIAVMGEYFRVAAETAHKNKFIGHRYSAEA